MKKQSIILLSILLVLSAFLTACGGGNNNDNDTADTGSGKDEQVLNLLESSEIPSLDSTLGTDSVSFNVMNNVFEGLYRLGEGDEPVLGMAAEEPEVSEDGKTYTFKIRDAKWSNGEPVTAKDFEYAWKKALDPDNASEYAYIMFDIKNAEKVNNGELPLEEAGIKALDDKTLQLELETIVPYFKSLLTFATFLPQNEAFVEEQGDQYGLEADTAIYNGPFVLSDWKHEQSFQMKKNTDYWEADVVKLEEINFNIVKDTSTRVNLYETNETDVAVLSEQYVDTYQEDPNFNTQLRTSTFFLRLNQENEVLSNKNARKAFDMAWDKEGLVEVLLNDGSIPAYYLVPDDFVTGPDGEDFRDTNGKLGEFNPEEAAKLWNTAKEELGIETASLELLNYDSENSRKVGEYLKEQLENTLDGLTISISQQPFAQKLEVEQRGDYDFSYAGWGPDYPDPMTFLDMFITGSSYNQTGFSNEKYDQLIEDAQTTLLDDPEKRWEALLEAEQILLEEQAISPMFQDGSAYLQREYVKDLYRHSFGADYSYKWTHIE
ncbi:peptide ABC transporter substrate-binding protein [Rossellomorea vietnamensis]|uniref:Peptide ABC transporter substrate-binding protein n=1 Tax=Rossellomorea vietnamensis TaxID=218284 RepID=A0A5D4MF62_9BACI|nr:peptide ABC transporter substrate-binding protein [Rossellomorea vietnamensis]TYS00343.1 peptide ABC transporter substrate-binding protein [Rossellomorea vietnamensis]